MSKNALTVLVESLIKEALTEASKKVYQEEDEVSIRLIERHFQWFHLSFHDAPTITLKLHTPLEPYYDGADGSVIEDNFTKRSSVAPSIKKALEALQSERSYTIYVGDIKGWGGDDMNPVNLAAKHKDCPKSKGNPYNTEFSYKQWFDSLPEDEQVKVDRHERNTGNLPPDFEGCVPDAKQTKEHWLLEPDTLINIGYYQHPNQVVLSKTGADILNKIQTGKEIDYYA